MAAASEPQQANLNVHPDGRVEIADDSVVKASPVFNEDLAPIPVAKRHWSWSHFSALWAGMACNIPTYMMASGLITSGMNWWQALLCVLLGNLIVLVPILLNSHAGTKYGIPFPVLVRASYGVIGSNLPALMRALVACGWFGINAWIGGQALFTLVKALVPGWSGLLGPAVEGHTPTEWISFLLFWVLNIFVIFHGMEFLRKLETWAAPFVLSMTALLTGWTVYQAHGFGVLVEDAGKFPTLAAFLPVFVPSVTAMVGSWATLSLNMPDFTRFSRSQKDQVKGQILALPASMTAFAGMGVITTSAGMVLYPHMELKQLWDPITLIGNFTQPLVVAIAMFTVMLATLAVNVAANVVSPANDLANCFPRWISFKRGALITGIVGILIQPWRLIADPQAYIFSWLLGYGGGLGSIAGVMIVDYWLIRKRNLNLIDLYLLDGEYRYTNGWNLSAVLATVAGCAAAWIGIVWQPARILYDYSWFVGLGTSCVVYYALMKESRVRSLITLLAFSIGCCCAQPAMSATQEVNYIEAKHEIFGEQRIYVSKDFFRLDLDREGTTFVRKKNDKEPYIFNREKKVYFRGDNSSAMKRADLMAFVSGHGDATKDWSKFKWKFEGKDTICKTPCRRYSHKGNQLVKVWICDFPGIDKSLFKDHIEWSKSPDLGGLPLRMLVISYLKKGGEVPVIAFNTKKIGKVKMNMDELEIPKGAKRVTNVFELSSNRTSELMDEFSTILGD